jgi:hypothetical protein
VTADLAVEGATALDRAAAVEQCLTELVRSAPGLDPALVDAALDDLRSIRAPLALSIARVLELVGLQLIDPGVALPPLAMACATLADGLRGSLGPRELEAARYEIETLLPVPDPPSGGARPSFYLAPQVPLSALRRRRS